MEDILSTNIPPLRTNGNEESQNFSSKVTSDGYKQQPYAPNFTKEQTEKMKQNLDSFLDEQQIDVENPIDPPEFLVKVNDVPILPIGDLSIITGEKKSGKSTVYQVIVAILLGLSGVWGHIVRLLKDPKIAIFDSEQARFNAQQAIQRILRMAGLPQKNIFDKLRYIPLRKLSSEDRLQLIGYYLEVYRPNVVVIDCITDLIKDFNSIEESKPFIDQLMTWATVYNCCIIGIIHTSKSMPDEPRGHAGAFAVEKAYFTMKVTVNIRKIFTASTSCCRGVDMPEWSFKYDGNDIVPADEDMELYKKAIAAKQKESRNNKSEENYQKQSVKVLELIRKNSGHIKKSDLVKLIEETDDLGLKSTAAYKLLTKMLDDKKILEENKGKLQLPSE